jgi:ferredoxin
MSVYVNRGRCCYCGGCVGICPKDALELRETILFVNNDKCIECGICIKFCPVDALSDENVGTGI